MRYLSDTRTIVHPGKYALDLLTDEDAMVWLERGPVESKMRHADLALILGSITRHHIFLNRKRAVVDSFLDLAPRDEALLCTVEYALATSKSWSEISLEEKREHFQMALLSCWERYTGYLTSSAPLLLQENAWHGQRYVVSTPTLSGPGDYDFQAITRDQAMTWLGQAPYLSRVRLHQMAAAFEYLLHTPMSANYEAVPPMRAGDQALAFYVGTRGPGIQLKCLCEQDILDSYDLGLLTCLEAREERQKDHD